MKIWHFSLPPSVPRLTLASWLLLIAIITAAVVIRFVGLDHLPGLNGDEAVFPVHAWEWRSGVPLSELRTGTNLPMNPVFFGLVAVIQAVLPTSLWTLRLAALTHSLLAVALAFFAFRHRGVNFAALFAMWIAVLPIQLGYARLAWDPTAVPTVVLLALAAAIRGRIGATMLAFALCLWVHPSAVFVAPVLTTALLAVRWPRDTAGQLRPPSRRALALTGLCSTALLAAGVWSFQREVLPTPVLAALRGWLLARLHEGSIDLYSALEFALLYADFISGPTIYRYVTGSMPSGAAGLHVALAVAAFVAVVWVALRRLPAATRTTDRAVALGLLLSLVGSYLAGGLEVLTPHTERYGMFLVAPTCYVLAACTDAFAGTVRGAAFARLGAAVTGAALLGSFGIYFLSALHHVDPERHNTFRTGQVDPKQRAFEVVLAKRAPARSTVVLVEDWWIYWPMRYLASDHSNLWVTIAGTRWDYRFPRDFEVPPLDPENTQLFSVAWAGSRVDVRFAAGALDRMDIKGYGRDTILHVYRSPMAGAR